MLGNDFYFFHITIGLFAVIFWWKSAQGFLNRRKIKDTARSKISTAPQGLIEIQGFAWPKNSTTETSTDHNAVYFNFEVQKEVKRGSGKNQRTEWVSIFQSVFSEPYFVYDGTAVAEVESSEAEYEEALKVIRPWHSISESERKKIAKDILKGAHPEMGAQFKIFGLQIGGGVWRVLETKILVGSPIYARGTFKSFKNQPETVQSMGLTDFSNRIFDPATKKAKRFDSLMDENNDQFVDAREAEKGYSTIGLLASKTSLAKKITERNFPFAGVMISEPEHKLYVAGAHEEQLSHSLAKQMRQSAVIAMILTIGLAIASNDKIMKNMGDKLSAVKKYGFKSKRSPSSK